MDRRISVSNVEAIWAPVGMMSTVPISAWAIRRTSATCQADPTPRQSHWNWPLAARIAALSCSGVSCWFCPSVKRMACFCARDGTVAKTRVAMVSQVPMAVPPSARKDETARFADSRVVLSIWTMASSARATGNASRASWVPAMTANQVPSMIWSMAAAAACWAMRMLTSPIDPDVSTMTISPASPWPTWPAAPAPVQVTVTTACTSVPPSGRNSF